MVLTKSHKTKSHKWILGIVVTPIVCALIAGISELFSGPKTTEPTSNDAKANVSVQVALPSALEKSQTPQAPKSSAQNRVTKAASPPLIIEAPVQQSATAPCSGNAIGGSVDLSNCNAPADPYQMVVTYSPNGIKHMSRGNSSSADDHLLPVTQQVNNLFKSSSWRELLVLDEETRRTDPAWPSLEYNDGIAEMMLCKPLEGKSHLASFKRITENAAEYEKMRDLAEHAIEKMGEPAYYSDCKQESPN